MRKLDVEEKRITAPNTLQDRAARGVSGLTSARALSTSFS